MSISYFDELGLDANLTKPNVRESDPDVELDDESISGVKLMKKSVSLDRLYGQDLEIGGSSNISGTIKVYGSNNAERVSIDATNGITVTDAGNNTVFKTTISGDDVGDVTLGNYFGSDKGLLYDKSTGSFTVKGIINMGTGSTLNADAISAITIDADQIVSGDIQSARLQTNVLSALQASITNLSAIEADIGNITAGSMTGVTITGGTIRTASSGARVQLTGGTKQIEIYNNSNMRGHIYYYNYGGKDNLILNGDNGADVIISGNAVRVFDAALYAQGGLIVTGGELQVTENNLYWYDSRLVGGHNRYAFKDNGGTERFSIQTDASPNTQINMNGFSLRLTSNKTAILPTSRGYRALYCMESPDVWFMDFCKGKRKLKLSLWPPRIDWDWQVNIDPLFAEVTEPPYVVIPTGAKGIIQLWGKRKGFADKRFEEKTEAEFNANNEFWSTPQRKAKIDKEPKKE